MFLIGSVWVLPGGSGLSLDAAEDLSREVKRAIKNVLKEDPAKQNQGIQELRQLGDRALRELRVWIARAEKSIERARRALQELEEGNPSRLEPVVDPAVRSFVLRKLEAGWEALREGDYKLARSLAQGLLALDPDSELLFDYRRLFLATEKRTLAKEVLEPLVEFHEQIYEFGEDPHVSFRLKNHSDDLMMVMAKRGVLGTLQIQIDKRLLNGGFLRESQSIEIKTYNNLERLNLPKGKGYETDVRIPVDVEKDETSMVIRVQVVGRFRPSQWGVDGRNVNVSLELPETECWLVPRGEGKELALSPLKNLEVALFFRQIQRFFCAGQLAIWAAEDDPVLRERLVRVLVGSLSRLDRIGFPIANHLLLQATGVDRKVAVGREFWQKWLEDHGEELKSRPTKPIRLEFLNAKSD